MLNWAIISAVNDERVLRSCLLRSPDLANAAADQLQIQQGYPSAAEAYNHAIDTCRRDVLVFVHQDVYLPPGWLALLERQVDALERTDKNWGVLGSWGIDADGQAHGHMFCGATGEVLGSAFSGGREVATLDEVLLIIRKSSGLRFDPRLRGFHMYGVDLCLEATRRGLKNYSLAAFAVHNTNGYKWLPLAFWRAYLFVRRKWKSRLPVRTSCIAVTRFGFSAILWNLRRLTVLVRGRYAPTRRVDDPEQLLAKLRGPGAAEPVNSCGALPAAPAKALN